MLFRIILRGSLTESSISILRISLKCSDVNYYSHIILTVPDPVNLLYTN